MSAHRGPVPAPSRPLDFHHYLFFSSSLSLIKSHTFPQTKKEDQTRKLWRAARLSFASSLISRAQMCADRRSHNLMRCPAQSCSVRRDLIPDAKIQSSPSTLAALLSWALSLPQHYLNVCMVGDFFGQCALSR